ncbi:MAG: hypothetical protein HeimC3_53690 [Candidatus Heimdallarchaeota archaeon LC_3]|nr:MAG: hypothetical protein HeimC3_53690 [Candidatus Heimdallarchaeota archaeon LC_3]
MTKSKKKEKFSTNNEKIFAAKTKKRKKEKNQVNRCTEYPLSK